MLLSLKKLFDEKTFRTSFEKKKLFYHALNAKYFYVQQFFFKEAVFSKETAKNYFGGAFDYFLGKGNVLR